MRKGLKRVRRLVLVPFEWVGIGIAYLVFSSLSHRALFKFCDVISAVMYCCDGRGRRLARQNLEIMFGARLSSHRAELIPRRSYRNMARTVGHAFWTCRNARSRVKEVGEMAPRVHEFLAANKPAVTVSGHIGCWEILSQLALLEGHAMMSVAKNIGTSGMTRLLMRARQSVGQEIVSAEHAFLPLMKGLKRGKSLGLLVDQPVRTREGGVFVRFFGRPVPVSAAPAYFADKLGAPIIVAWSRPFKNGHYCCTYISSYSAQDAHDTWLMTQRCMRDLEGVIRRHPSCWILNYNEFRKRPTDDELKELLAREAAQL